MMSSSLVPLSCVRPLVVGRQTKNNSVVLPCVIFCRGHRWDIPRYVVDTLKKLYIHNIIIICTKLVSHKPRLHVDLKIRLQDPMRCCNFSLPV